ncbi:hypothetical protein ACET3Z_030755 [Daucus carota]
MKKSEPSFVPEWLKSSGSVTVAVSTNHRQNDHMTLKPTRNKLSADVSAHDSGRSPVSDRTTSSYFRRTSSSNGSGNSRSYGSFGRNNRDRGWDRDKNEYRDHDRLRLGDRRHQNYSGSLGSDFSDRFEKNGLRRTQSSVAGKHSEPLSRRVSADLNSSNKSNYNNSSSRLLGSSGISSVRKTSFDRDFPSLGADERQTDHGIRNIPSPGLSTNVQSLSTGYSTVANEVGWTSALAEVPVMVGANGPITSSVVQAALPSSTSVPSSTAASLNMAETLAQGPLRVDTAPQVSVETQRLEELAIKQSRQLIPMTPSMPKSLVLNSSEKSKVKVSQQQHQTSSIHSLRGTLEKSDVPKTLSLGKLQVLKPARERNGVSYPEIDNLSLTNDSTVANNPLTTLPAVVPPPSRTQIKNPNPLNVNRKPAAIMVPATLEKKPSAQLQSRNEFFNLVRKKSLTKSSSVADSVSTVSQFVVEQPSETQTASPLSQGKDSLSANQSNMDHYKENVNALISNINNGNGHQQSCGNGETRSRSDMILCSEEEEAAFLRSLGWDENAGEDEGLTEEEINEFYRDASKYIKPGSSSKTSL